MDLLKSLSLAALVMGASLASADPMRDGQPVLEGKIDRFECEQTLRTLIEKEGVSKELRLEYVESFGGFLILKAETKWFNSTQECAVYWYRKTGLYNVRSDLEEARPGARNWSELDLQSKKGANLLRDGLESYLQDDPRDLILEPVLRHTTNVKVKMTTMFSSFADRKKAPAVLTEYHSKDF